MITSHAKSKLVSSHVEGRSQVLVEAPLDQQEDSSDFTQESRFNEAVVTATDWTTQTVLSQLEKGNIELNPAFQRRDAWKVGRKSKFIESLILGIPVPQLVLAERKQKRNSFIVIDGKQRLLALRQFCSEIKDRSFDSFSLTSLDIRHDLNGVSFNAMSSDNIYAQDITNFENQPIRTVVIRNWPSEQFLYQVFLRLNTGSVPLSPQELRQALHPGPFSSFVDQFSMESDAIRQILGLKSPDFRMRDAELVIRYFSFRNFLAEYKGNLAPLFDFTTERLNDGWRDLEQRTTSQAAHLEEAIAVTRSIFGENAFRKWNGSSYERLLNRAIFDIMVLFFDKPDIRRAALAKSSEIEFAFRNLCASDLRFRSSIEGTTKSIDAIFARLSIWSIRLAEILGGDLVMPPLLVNGHITL